MEDTAGGEEGVVNLELDRRGKGKKTWPEEHVKGKYMRLYHLYSLLTGISVWARRQSFVCVCVSVCVCVFVCKQMQA